MGFNCPHCTKEIEQGAIVERITKLGEEKSALEKQLGEAQKGAKLAEKHATKIEQLEKQLGEVTARHGVEMAMSDAGIKDRDVREAFEWQYGRLDPGEGKQKQPFGEWLEGIKGKPEEAPVVLRPFLKDLASAGAGAGAGAGKGGAAGGAGGGAGAGAGGAGGRTPPPGNQGAGRGSDQVGAWDPNAVAQLSVEQIRANYENIMQSWGMPAQLPPGVRPPPDGAGAGQGGGQGGGQ